MRSSRKRISKPHVDHPPAETAHDCPAYDDDDHDGDSQGGQVRGVALPLRPETSHRADATLRDDGPQEGPVYRTGECDTQPLPLRSGMPRISPQEIRTRGVVWVGYIHFPRPYPSRFVSTP